MLLYNIPGRSGVALSLDTLRTLAKEANIVGVKDATGSLDTATDLSASHPGFTILSGDDALTLPFMSLGARGVVSVVSNRFPEASVELVAAALAGNFVRARAVHEALLPFARAAFIESNPGPIKAALVTAQVIGNSTLRLPLVGLADASAASLAAATDRSCASLAAIGVANGV